MTKYSKEASVFFHPDTNFGKPIPKRYAIGLVWRGKKPFYKSIDGYEVSYYSKSNLEDVKKYYKKRLVNSGWEIDNRFNADGPHGRAWSFCKGKDLVIFTYHIIHLHGRKSAFRYLLSVFTNNKKYLDNFS